MKLSRPIYLLAASWCDAATPPDMSELEAIKPRSALKLHWADMNDDLKVKSLQALSHLDMVHTVVIAEHIDSKRTERARRKCMERLLPHLEENGVTSLLLESRGPSNNARDIEMAAALRSAKVIFNIVINHKTGDEDHRLWIPDQILGAYVEWKYDFGAYSRIGTPRWKDVTSSVETMTLEMN